MFYLISKFKFLDLKPHSSQQSNQRKYVKLLVKPKPFVPYLRRRWQPTPVLLPGKSHGWRSLVGYSLWDCEELNTTERLHFTFHFHALEEEMATHTSILAWRIPGTRGLVGCHLWGHTESDTTNVT